MSMLMVNNLPKTEGKIELQQRYPDGQSTQKQCTHTSGVVLSTAEATCFGSMRRMRSGVSRLRFVYAQEKGTQDDVGG